MLSWRSSIRSQAAASPLSQPGPRTLSNVSWVSGITQVRACTPLVTDPISLPPGIEANRSRLVLPCSSDTPLERPAKRRHRAAVLNLLWSSSGSWPKASSVSVGTFQRSAQNFNIGPMSCLSKRSIPAGTGVCVVNTKRGLTALAASSRVAPARSSLSSSSKIRNPACPSFRWITGTFHPSAARALIPPTPRTISWARRWRRSPLYRRSVIPRSSSLLASMSVSSRISGTRPTSNCHRRAATSRPKRGTVITSPVSVAPRLSGSCLS